MMADKFTISTQKPSDPAFDYEEFRKTGIQILEETTSSVWTDYNVHDPGITTLELLCYALTDLSYRSAYSIPDLLATEKDTVQNIQQHFFSAKKIFPNKAVTINDYRKMLVDTEGVKNAWLKKRTRQIFADIINKKLTHKQPLSRKWKALSIKGYYDVLLEFDTNVSEDAKGDIKIKAKELLMDNRNLCEDFINIDEVPTQEFRLCSEAEIKTGADPVETLAKIFFNIQLYLNPLIQFYSLRQLFDENYTSDKIFEGPLLSNGFIKEEELIGSELKTEIHLSDIMQEILKEDAVINISDIIFNPIDQVGELQNKWVIQVKEGRQAIINIMESNIVLYKDGIPIAFRPQQVALAKVKARFEKLMSDYITANDAVITEDISYNTGTYRHAENYYSIQNHYPKNYGISHWGLPGDATNERVMQAKQFQGYLFFFDQQLANYLSQLSHLGNLFSFEDESKTYFTQLANSFKDAKDLFVDEAAIAGNLQAAAEPGAEEFAARRNLFLDHLLSRFAESFFDYVNILQTVFPSIDKKEIINAKTRFLKKYPEYSTERLSAYNYTNGNLWNSATENGGNISGLEKRLEHLLGFKDTNRRSLVNVYSSVEETVVSNTSQFSFRFIDNRNGNVLLKSNDTFQTGEEAKLALDAALEFADTMHNYEFTENTGGTFSYQLKNADKIIGAGTVEYSVKDEAINDAGKLVSFLSGGGSDEGMFLIEHLLLLPEISVAIPQSPPQSPPLSPPDPIIEHTGFMPICLDENCEDCESLDLYSFRISIILPAYASRFLNMDFRRYCERIIRMETPAHIFPKICWVNNEDLQKFETAYKPWLEVKAGARDDQDNTILESFINILTTLKTVYPPARLEDCKSAEERKLFLLNQNALGTLKT